jgi:hypothetical protein
LAYNYLLLWLKKALQERLTSSQDKITTAHHIKKFKYNQ